MRWVFVPLLVCLLSGCLDAAEESETAPLDAMEEPEGEGNETVQPTPASAPANNTAPEVDLSVAVDGLNATFRVNVTDADGDAVSWSLDADGDGAPDAQGAGSGNATFAYAAAGNHTATVEATDGNATATAQVEVRVAEAPVAPSEPAHPGQAEERSWLTGVLMVGCFGDNFGAGYPSGGDGVTHATFPVEAATWGYDYVVEITAAVADSPGISFLDEAGGVVAGGFLGDAGSGAVPEGAVTGVFWTCAGADLTGSYTSTPP